MTVVVTIAALNLDHGGPPRTVLALCRALARPGVNVELVTVSEGRQTSPIDEGVTLTILPTRTDRYHPSPWRATFREAVERAAAADECAIIFDVGLWLPSNHYSARIAARNGTPFMASPRGMLSSQALQVASLKKRLAWRMYQRRDLRSARVLHATSESEAKDFRVVGLKQPIAVIPNGTDIPQKVPHRAKERGKRRTLLFLSRLHPIKGLEELVRAWDRVRPKNWRAVIAGPDENNYRTEMERLVAEFSLESAFEFVGPATEAEKWDLMANADLFVLPSHSESFGLAIAEALASGLPVITTRATPWKEIDQIRCGWWVEPSVDSLSDALRKATTRSGVELRQMGMRGRELIQQKYSWSSAAEKMLNVYEWILNRGPRPDCVIH